MALSRAVGLLIATALLGLTLVVCTGEAKEDREVSAAKDGMKEVANLVEGGQREAANGVFSEVHPSLHSIATRVGTVDPNGAEVIHDITEVIEMTFADGEPNDETLTALSRRAIEYLEAADYYLS